MTSVTFCGHKIEMAGKCSLVLRVEGDLGDVRLYDVHVRGNTATMNLHEEPARIPTTKHNRDAQYSLHPDRSR